MKCSSPPRRRRKNLVLGTCEPTGKVNHKDTAESDKVDETRISCTADRVPNTSRLISSYLKQKQKKPDGLDFPAFSLSFSLFGV